MLEGIFIVLKEKDDAELLPDVIRIQLFGWLAALDVFIENRSNIGFGDLGIPRVVRVHHDGRSLLAGAQAGGACDEDFAGHDAALHETHVEGHEQLCGTLAAAGRFRVTRRTGVRADKDMIFRFWHRDLNVRLWGE